MMDTALQTRVTAGTTPAPAPWGRVRRSRHVADRALKIVCTLFTILGATVLGWILLMLLVEGIGGLSAA
jgi:phosphate transport system permease protein